MGISWALYLIGLHKDVQEKIQTELNRIFGDDYERSITTDDLKDMEYLDRVLKVRAIGVLSVKQTFIRRQLVALVVKHVHIYMHVYNKKIKKKSI